MTVTPLNPKAKNGYRVINRAGRGEIYLYGIIGADWFGDGVTAKQFSEDMKALKGVKDIDLRINSEGGSVFDGKTMYSLLRDHGARITVHVDGLAASAASFIAMAGDEIRIAEGAFIMIHNARGGAYGEPEDIRRYADMVEQVNDTIVETYVKRTGRERDEIAAWMDAETWFAGPDAVKNGFADMLVENLKVAASVADPTRYKKLPAALRPNMMKAQSILDRLK